uniref:Matrix protein n=2 Tax=Morbillivirus caprinae TaxID=3052343 RepID=A0A2I6YYI7_9MONO|nr:matrix protein [Peste des petits ruminants virus]UTR29898.1 matrix protein [Peste des petits ruminants virus]UXG78344.1 matrix protein [Peste des petits ruminants virus]UXG78352.1 matrix protein [Peste des petits ruminants virus]UXG78360.1 matrix protein [Peste des petits ruminants virus]
MTEIYDFDKSAWDVKGSIARIEPTTYHDGRLIPHVRVIDPGLGDRKDECFMYLFLLGVIEDNDPLSPPVGRTFGSLPLGVGRSTARPEELLREATELDIVVRRTAGLNEKLVFYNNTPLSLLTPWRKVLTTGSVFSANQVCNAVNLVPLDTPQRFRVVYMSITRLSDNGYYSVPRRMLEFRSANAVAFNILVTLRIENGTNPSRYIVGSWENPEVTFMVHVGNFRRKKNKVYSADYCKMKIEKMGLVFALGGIGGTSLHIRSTGKMSKTLHAQLGFKKILCYPLMDINEDLNRYLWRAECRIVKIQAVLQPSVPQEFRVYDDVIINDDQGLFKIL